MNKEKIVKVTKYQDEIDTCESYNKTTYVSKGNNLIIPLVNTQILNKKVLNSDVLGNLSYCYLIISGVSEIAWQGGFYYGKGIVGKKIFTPKINNKITDWFGINDIEKGFEVKIKFENLHIYLPKETELKNCLWAPWDTPNFKQNISSQVLDNFFALKLLPEEILNQINFTKNNIEILEFEDAKSEQEKEKIYLNWSKK